MIASLLTFSVAGPSPVAAELPSTSTSTSFDAGAYIVDMGQSADPAVDLLPYGFVYELMVNQQIPVYWAIRSDKVKDGTVDEIDFSVDGTDYRGGAFIVPAEFVAEALPTITTFRGLGVKIEGPVSGFDAPLFSKLTSWPNAVLDLKNGGIAAAYYENAGIPSAAYREGLPSDLSDCDDIYVMPHADPEWESHSNLVPFNDAGGYIWAACHAVSVLENVDDPASADPAPDMNFLSVDGLIDFGDHDGGDGVYAYNAAEGGDPIFQFIGRIDSATENGSEQIYLPQDGGWRPSSKVLVWDDDHPEVPSPSPGEAAKLIYGRGFGDETNGLVMYEGGHSHNKGDAADVVAAQRAFFNLHLLAGIERGIDVEVTTPATIGAGETVAVSAVIEGGSHDYDWTWTSSCGGTFADATGSGAGDPVNVATTFTAPAGAGDCTVRLSVSDTCDRVAFGASATVIVEFVDLGLTKVDSNDPIEAGGDLTYTLTVSNAGPGDATNVTVTDTLPPEVYFVQATPSQGDCSFLGTDVVCDVGTVTTSSPVTIDIAVTIDPSASGTITNAATVSADQAETDPSDNTASEDTLTGAIGLTLDKTADPAFLDGAGNVTYTFLVGNDGPNDLTSVVLNDDQCSPQVRQPDQLGNGDDVLEPGELWEFTCTVLVSADTTNTADVTADDPLLGPITVVDTAEVDVIAPSISIAKNPATQNAPENGEAVFDIVVTNDGDVDLVNAFVTDPLAASCDRFIRSLAVGESLDYSCSLAVGAIGTSGTNTIDVTASDPGGTPVTAQDTADWTVIASDLEIAKTNDATGPLVPGDTVTYTIEVENTGATTQNDVVVSDVLPTGFNWVSTTVNRPITLVEDDFSGDVEKQYPLAWQEWNDNTPADRSGGDIKLTNCVTVSGNTDDCELLLDKENKGVYQAVDLTGVTNLDVTFDWAVQKTEDGTATFVLALWDGSAWQTVGGPYTLTAVGGFTTESVLDVDPAAVGGDIAGGRIGFITAATNTGNDEALIDDVSITVSGQSVLDESFIDPGKDYFRGWQEGEGTDKFGGDVRVFQTSGDSQCDTNAECVARLNKGGVDLFFPADLTGVTSASVTFDWSTLENDNDGGESFELVVWDGLAWVPVPGAAYPLAASGLPTAFTTESETFDPSALSSDIAGGRIGFRTSASNDDKDTIYIDNVTMSVLADVTGNPSPNLVAATDDLDLPAGATATITLVAHVDPTLSVFYPLDQVNTASATSDETTTPVQAASAVKVVVPGVDIVKTADPTVVSPGDPVTYTFVVTNTGNDPVTPVLSDPDCGPITLDGGDSANPGVLDLLEVWTYSCTTTAPVTTNTATVNATDSLGNPVAPAQDSATIEIIESDIAVTKTADPLVVRPGETATYTYEVTTAASLESLSSVYVSDDSCAPVAPVGVGGFNTGDTNTDGMLDPTETWRYTCATPLTVTTTNTATAVGVDRAARTVSATDTATVDVIEPAIAIDKLKLAPTDPVPAGATVTYGFDVTNPGNDPLGAVTVTDPFCSPVVFDSGDTNTDNLLDPTETWRYTCDAVVDVDTLNVASVTGTDSLGATVTADDQLLVDVQAAELALGKVASPTVVGIGDTTTYTYKLFNAGDTTFFDFAGTGTVADDRCSPLARIGDLVGDDDIDLEPGESWRYECTSTITGDITNTFTAQGVDEFGDTVLAEPATAFVAALDPTVGVVKTADQTVVTAGTSVTYTYEITHTGTIPTIFNFVTVADVSDDRCSPLTFVGGDTDGDNQLGFDIDPASPTFGDPETWVYSCSSTITATTTNTVTVTGTDTLGDPIPDATDTATVVVSNPDFSVTKTAGNAADGEVEYIDAAGPVTYTYVVENTGDDPLTAVGIVDSPACTPIALVGGDTANPGVLDTDETWTYECTQPVSGDVTNTVTVTGTDLLGNPVVRTDDAVVDLVAPAATIDKTSYVGADSGASCPGSDITVGDAGDDLTYCFVVTNSGDTHLDSIAIDDTLLGITEADMSSAGSTPIPPGGSITFWYETAIGGDLVNTAAVTANPTTATGTDLPDVGDATDSDDAAVVEVDPSLSLEKTVYAGTDAGASCPGTETALVGAGQDVVYCFVITNTGDTHLDDVTFDDGALGLTAASLSLVGGTLPLAPGASATFTAPGTAGPTDLVNTATASATPTDSGGAPLTNVDAPTSAPDSANVDVVNPGMEIAKTVYLGGDSGASCPGSESIVATGGSTVTYCFAVTNTGDVDLDDITIVDADVDLSGLSPDPATLAPLAPGSSQSFFVEATVAGSLVNTASVSATPVDPAGDPVPGAATPVDDDTAEVIEVNPAITIAKSAYIGSDLGASCPGGEAVSGDPGDPLTYCFAVTNDGDTHLDDIVVSDPDLDIPATFVVAPDPATVFLAPGETQTFYFDTTVSGDLLPNTATVAANPTDAGRVDLAGLADVTDDDTANVDEANPALTIAKTVTIDGGTCPGVETLEVGQGQALTYCFVVTNSGDTYVDDIVIDDPALGGALAVTPDPATLAVIAPGATRTFTFAAVAGATDLTNTATASATPTDAAGVVLSEVTSPVSAPDTATVDVVNPGIALSKTVYWGADGGTSCAGLESVPAVGGDAVTYCFAVTNTGDIDLSSIGLSDPALGIDENDLTPDPATVVPLAPGSSATFWHESTVSGDLVNTASVTAIALNGAGDPVPGATVLPAVDSAEVVEFAPAVEIAKTVYVGHDGGSSCAGVDLVQTDLGGDVTYCFAVTNTGDIHVDDLSITDVELGITDADLTSIAGDPLPLAPGGTRSYFFEATFDQVNAGRIFTNNVDVSANPTTARGDDLANLDDVTDRDAAMVEASDPAIEIAKSVYLGHDAGASCAGTELVRGGGGAAVTYCFQVTNTGGTYLDDVAIDDVDLAITETDLTAVSGSFPLAPGGTAMWFHETTVAGDLLNTASATATPTDADGTPTGQRPPVGSDTAQVDEPTPGTSLAKTVYVGHDGGASCDGGATVAGGPGLEITYCFTVTNTGDTHLDDVTIDDPALGITDVDLTAVTGAFPLAPGASATWYHETATAGDLTNTASVTANPTEADGADIPAVADVTDDGSAVVDETPVGIDLVKSVYAGHDGGASCPGVGTQLVGAGQDVTYCFVVTNTSDAPTHLDDVAIDDVDLGIDETSMTLGAGTFPLAPGASATFYVETTATADLVNTADASANPTDVAGTDLPGVSDPTSQGRATVDVVAPGIDIAKTVYWGADAGASCPGTESVPAANGDTVTYCFAVTNTGDVDLDDITILDSDVDLSGLSPDPAGLSPLAPGASQTFFVEATVDGDLVNTASATATPVDPSGDPVPGAVAPTDDDTATVDELAPAVTVDKTAYIGTDAGASCPGSATVVAETGDPLVYCFVVTNSGDTHLDDVTVVDADLGITQLDMFVFGSTPIAPGDSITYTYPSAATADLVNTADVSANPTDPSGVDLPNFDDPTGSDTATLDVVDPGLTIAKTVTTGVTCPGVETVLAGEGQAVTYCFTVTNTGDVDLDDIVIEDPALGGTLSVTPDPAIIGPIPPTGSVTFTYAATAGTSDLTNAARASATPVDGAGDPLPGIKSPTSPVDTATVDVVIPAVEIAKSVYWGHDGGSSCAGVESAPAVNGDAVTYCFAVTNTGEQFLAGIDVTDPALGLGLADLTLVAADSTPLAMGDTATWFYETTVDGDLVNTASASANPVDAAGADIAGAADPTDDDTAEVDEVAPEVAVVKSAYVGADAGASCPGSATVVADAGDPLVYCFVVTNTGDTHLDDLSIDDVDLGITEADMTLVSGTTPLVPGASATWSFESTVAGDLVNTADVSANPTDGSGVDLANIDDPTDTGSATVDEVDPDLALAKTVFTGHDGGVSCDGLESVLAGSAAAVTYCFTVTNTGDTHLDTITIDDPDLGITESDLTSVSATVPLTPGASATWYFETTVAGDLVNTATASATATDGAGTPHPDVDAPTSEPDTATVDEINPAIEIAKSVYVGHDAGAGCPGDPLVRGGNGLLVTYCFEVVNTGDSYLRDLVIDDPALGIGIADLTEVAGDKSVPLAPGDSLTLFYEAAVGGSLVNTAAASANPTDAAGIPIFGATPPEDSDSATVEETPIAVDLVKSVYVGHDGGAGCAGNKQVVVVPGTTVTFCFVVTNTSADPTHLDDVSIDDAVLGITEADMTLVSGTTPLAPGESLTYHYDTVASADVLNTAEVTAAPTDANGDPLPGTTPPIDDGDAEVRVVDPQIEVVKVVDQPVVDPGTNVTWTSRVTNTGDVALGEVELSDASCPGGADGPVEVVGNRDDVLDPGEVWEYRCDEVVFEDRSSTSDVIGRAYWDGPLGDPVPVPGDVLPGGGVVDDTATADVRVRQVDLALTKTLDTRLVAGESAVYTIVVTNNGRDAADDVVVSDELPAGLTYITGAGAGWDCSAANLANVTCSLNSLAAGASSSIRLTVDVASDASGAITNVASVESRQSETAVGLSDNTDRAAATVVEATTPEPPAASPRPLPATGSNGPQLWRGALGLIFLGLVLVLGARRRHSLVR